MNNRCGILIKNQNIAMPSYDFIIACHEQYKKKYITLFYFDQKNLYVDKLHEDIDSFLQDSYSDVNKEDCFVILFHDDVNCYNDIEEKRLFYKTKQTIGISANSCDCINKVINMDKMKYKQLFSMFMVDNLYVELNCKSIQMYGDFFIKNDCFISENINENFAVIKRENMEIVDNIFADIRKSFDVLNNKQFQKLLV